MKIYVIGILFSILLNKVYSTQLINNTFLPVSMMYIAEELIGVPSSNFPSSSMLNYILYGYFSTTFFYYEFLREYGQSTNTFDNGNLVIGNDGVLGGICYGNQIVIIPIPNQAITRVPINYLNKYFPNGYSILQNTKVYDNYPYSGDVYGTFSGSKICDPCKMQLHTYKDYDLLSYKSVLYLQSRVIQEGNSISFYGYIDGYNPSSKMGSIKASFYEYEANKIRSFPLILDNNNDNMISFEIDSNDLMIINGNISLSLKNAKGYYYFMGVMHPS